MREAAIIAGTEIVNVLVIADGANGDATLVAMPDAVEITGMDPHPGIGTGWTYVDGEFVAPPEPELPEPV
jgi:hypothetical protein